MVTELPKGQDSAQLLRNDDPLDLQGSDHPRMLLVTSPLTSKNCLSTNGSIKIALGTKFKLGFINRKCERPEEESSTYDQWVRVDCMVRSWILNYISMDIIDAFIYTTSARDLWLELEERYGECNGPLLYQLQREIGSITQGSVTVEKYYTRLRKLWDEILCLMPVPICTCGEAKEVSDLASFNKLMQFLMGLNDSYNNIRNQILVMDPLPSVNKAYSMMVRGNNQRNDVYGRGRGNWIGRFNYGKGNNGRGNYRKLNNHDKDGSFYDYCNMGGHTKDVCFKIHGYQDGYKGQRGRESGGRNVVNNIMNLGDSPLDFEGRPPRVELKDTSATTNITSIVHQELMKMLKGNVLMDNVNQ